MMRVMTNLRKNWGIAAIFVLTVVLAAGYTATLASAQVPGVVLRGQDIDNTSNPLIQPSGVAVNQSLNNTDILVGTEGDDVIIGLLGSDFLDGSGADDILIGGTEQFTTPNSDIILGGAGDDISIWAPGDGSELFLGGSGKDILLFAVIDRDGNNIPTLTPSTLRPATGIPTANLTGSPGFCEVEKVTDPSLGYQFLVRFRVRATGALAVTLRTVEVESVVCTGSVPGQLAFADLTGANPQFIETNLDQLRAFSPALGAIVR